MKPVRTLATALALSLVSAPALAKPAGAPSPTAAAAPSKAKTKRAAKRAAKKRAKHKFRKASPAQRTQMRVKWLTNAGLTQAKAKKAAAVMAGYDTKRVAIRKQAKTHKKAMRKLLKAQSNDQAAYTKAINGLKGVRAQRFKLQTDQMNALQQVLTPKEQALAWKAAKKARRGKKAWKAKRNGKKRGKRAAAGRTPQG